MARLIKVVERRGVDGRNVSGAPNPARGRAERLWEIGPIHGAERSAACRAAAQK